MAANELLFYIANRFRRMPKVNWPLRGFDQEEIGQVFMIGCYEAIADVDPDIGNPIAYITTRGQWAVADYIRRHYRQQLVQYCPDCGSQGKPNRSDGQYVCRKCHSVSVELINPVTEYIEAPSGTDPDGQIIIQEFRSTLTGRKRDVFDLIVYRGIDRESSKNYIKEIADLLGVSQSNIVIRLRQIKKAWREYAAI